MDQSREGCGLPAAAALTQHLVSTANPEPGSELGPRQVACELWALPQPLDGVRSASLVELVPATVAVFMLTKTGSAFCTAYGKKIGEHFAERSLGLLGRHSSHREPVPTVLQLPTAPNVLLEIDGEQGLPDDALLALLSMDLKDPALVGSRLRWNTQTKTWSPIARPEIRKESA